MLNDCYICHKYRGQPYLYAEFLPLLRFWPNDPKPFAVPGVDLCGPILEKYLCWWSRERV